ncbi:MAG: hypothetical protein AAFX79_12755 [Planctomycetota bacterium]
MAEAITWAMLLARWTEFAKSAVALPTEGEGGRWRSSVPAVIALQATAMALGELDEVDDDERPLALDRASVTIEKHAQELAERWAGVPWPEELHELIEDARAALAAASRAGVEWCVEGEPMALGHPAELGASLIASGFAGDLYLGAPGATLSEGCPCAFVRALRGCVPDAEVLMAVAAFLVEHGDAAEPERRPGLRQAYRQLDFASGAVLRDLVVDGEDELRPGQPLLVPVVLAGELQSVSLPPRRSAPVDPPPLEFEAADAASGGSRATSGVRGRGGSGGTEGARRSG